MKPIVRYATTCIFGLFCIGAVGIVVVVLSRLQWGCP